jgi:RNA polymerase sigma factor (sigma-70 family)
MEADILIQVCPASVLSDVLSYQEEKMARIEQLLQEYPEDQRHVRFSFGCIDAGYVARAVLMIPTATLLACTPAPTHDHRAAIDQVVDQLDAELRRHKRQLRGDAVACRRRRRDRDFAAAEPHLKSLHAGRDQEGFFDMLHPLMRELREHARRELIIAQLEGDIAPGQMTVGDLLDEVLLRAWERWNKRPASRPLDRWLVGLLHEVLDERGFRPPDEPKPKRRRARSKSGAGVGAGTESGSRPESIYERLRDDDPHAEEPDVIPAEINPDSPYAAENGWAVENNPAWPFVDSLTRDDVLPSDDAIEPADAAAREEERRTILDELKKFPADHRRAFVLHVLEGWEIEEIAAAQHRPRDAVRADIDAVRRALRRRLTKVVHDKY